MSYSERDRGLLEDVLLACERIGSFVAGLDAAAFAASLRDRSAVERQLEIIGEAARGLSQESRDSQPDVPWRQLIGLRNLLAHGYRAVRADDIWEIATVHVPALSGRVRGMLAEPPGADRG